MTYEHRCRSSRGCRFFGTLLGATALSAAITYVLFGAAPSNARGPAPRPHDARAQEVSVDAQLVETEGGWSIVLNATNAAATERKCQIVASLTRTPSNTMSRVLPTPRVLWRGAVASTLPARGGSSERLAIPADIAKLIPSPQQGAALPGVRDHVGVQVQASCEGVGGNRVS